MHRGYLGIPPLSISLTLTWAPRHCHKNLGFLRRPLETHFFESKPAHTLKDWKAGRDGWVIGNGEWWGGHRGGQIVGWKGEKRNWSLFKVLCPPCISWFIPSLPLLQPRWLPAVPGKSQAHGFPPFSLMPLYWLSSLSGTPLQYSQGPLSTPSKPSLQHPLLNKFPYLTLQPIHALGHFNLPSCYIKSYVEVLNFSST